MNLKLKKIKLKITFKKEKNYLIIMLNNQPLTNYNKKPIEFLEEKEVKNFIKLYKSYKSTKEIYEDNIFKLLQFKHSLTSENKNIYIKEILNFVDTDSACYRADKGTELELMQKEKLSKLFTYCKKKYGIEFLLQYGVMPIKQSSHNLTLTNNILNNLNNYSLTFFYHITKISHSIIISLNIHDETITNNQAWELVNIETSYNFLKWGEDKEYEKKILLKKKLFTDIMKFKKYFINNRS